ncbi:MAG: endonuclease/exonuclease/phosphatase family protein, partial [Bacteroidia bacterium]|nr:endonuclease/exonuclease/phosphatase family protein [Bacteroidia bacterium]
MAEKTRITLRQWMGRGLLQAVLTVNLLTLCPSALALWAPYLSPAVWWAPSVCSMAMPWLALIPLFWTLVWLAAKFKIALINAVALALHWPALSATVQFNGPRTHKTKDFTIMSFNVNAFEYRQEKLRQITNFIHNKNPDIVCFQEYRDALDSAGTSAQYIVKRLGYKHKAFVELIPGCAYGLAFFSKYPIGRSGAITDPGPKASNGIAYADVKLYGQTLRVYNVHLESYKFAPHLREAMDAPPSMSLTASAIKDAVNSTKKDAAKKSGGSNRVSSNPKASAKDKPRSDKRLQAADSENSSEKILESKPKGDCRLEDSRRIEARTEGNPVGRKRKPIVTVSQTPNADNERLETTSKSQGLKRLWTIAKELLRTWDVHLEQIHRLSVHRGLIQSDEYDSPGGEVYTVVCGDLNNPPYNYLYHSVRADLSDAFMERGSGWGFTYG